MVDPAGGQVWGRQGLYGEGFQVERLAKDGRGDREDVSRLVHVWDQLESG